MQTYRALTFSEESFIQPRSREVVGLSFELAGAVDEAALAAAYESLLREVPALAAQVVTVSGTPHFARRDPAVAAETGFAWDPAPWRGYAQSPPPAVGEESLSALVLTGRDGSFRLTLWASHAAADGTATVTAALRLFALYTALVQGTPAAEQPALFPTEPHLLMAARGHVPGETDYEERLAGTRWHGTLSAPPVSVEPDSDEVARLRLDPQVTTALSAAARRHGLSLHALISGVIARAELAEYAGPSALALLMPVDLRHRIDPPIPPLGVTALCGFSYLAVVDDTTFNVARAISDQLRSDLRDGTVFRTSVSPMPDPATRRHGPPVLVSNLGVLPMPAVPDRLVVRDVHCQQVRSSAGVRSYVGSFTESAGSPPAPIGSSYLVSVFDERLAVELRALPGTLDGPVRARLLGRIELAARQLAEAEPA